MAYDELRFTHGLVTLLSEPAASSRLPRLAHRRARGASRGLRAVQDRNGTMLRDGDDPA